MNNNSNSNSNSNINASAETDDGQQLFLESADRFLERHSAAGPADGFSAARWEQFAEMGWLGLGLPEELGGFLSLHEAMLLMEKLGAAGLREPLMDNLILCGHYLANHGTTAQKAICAQMVQGKTILSWAMAETASRHDWADGQTALDSTGLILVGQKSLVACAQLSQYVLVLARESNEKGQTALLLPLSRYGIRLRHYATYDGRPCSDITFDQVQVFEDDVVGNRCEAHSAVEAAMNRAYVALACEAAGAMRSAYQLTLAYARTRKQFGKVLTANQAYQHALVDMYVAVEEAQGLAHHASQLLCIGGHKTAFTPAGESSPSAARWASAAKAFASADGRTVGEQSVQLHGAIGMTEDYAVGRHYKRLAAIANQYGDADWHLLRIRELDTLGNGEA